MSAPKPLTPLTALSPLDGRYHTKTEPLAAYFSEFALMKHRLLVEVAWFIALADAPQITELPPLTDADRTFLNGLVTNFDMAAAHAIKTIERKTNHDVKAIEYYLKAQLTNTALAPHREFVHFGCTSADINNLAYALMLKNALQSVWQPAANNLLAALQQLATRYQSLPMLAHTHGQPASPTTVGKEIAVFARRLQRQLDLLATQPIFGKMNGAVGNFNAHLAAYPAIDWLAFAREFVENRLGLTFNPLTTQIEPHDYLAEIFHTIVRANTITLDLARDMWAYISKGYFRQKIVSGETGSSTMPHKVNPIDFENAEGNMGLSNALLTFMAQKLPVSRWQRDLSDSTVMRNIGVGLGYSLLGLQSARRGLEKVSAAEDVLRTELASAWDVLAEAVQTVMRKSGIENPYEQLKAMTRGQHISADEMRTFIETLSIPPADKTRLLQLTPETYIGLAAKLATLNKSLNR